MSDNDRLDDANPGPTNPDGTPTTFEQHAQAIASRRAARERQIANAQAEKRAHQAAEEARRATRHHDPSKDQSLKGTFVGTGRLPRAPGPNPLAGPVEPLPGLPRPEPRLNVQCQYLPGVVRIAFSRNATDLVMDAAEARQFTAILNQAITMAEAQARELADLRAKHRHN